MALLSLSWVFARFLTGWLYTILMSSGTFLMGLMGMPQRAWLVFCRPWARGSLRILGVRVNIEGAENLEGPALFISAHQSLIDVVFLPAVLPRTIRWIAKKELARVPFFGWGFGQSGAIFIDRTDPRGAIASIRDGLQALPEGWSVIIFPEGTRSKDGKLGRFKKGAFHMAVQSRLPVVPIGMHGAHAIVPPKAWMVRPGVIELTAGKPIPTDDWASDQVEQRQAEMRAAVAACADASRERWEAAHGTELHMEPGLEGVKKHLGMAR